MGGQKFFSLHLQEVSSFSFVPGCLKSLGSPPGVLDC